MKTNFQMILDLEDFRPKNFGFISTEESKKIRETLCLDEMDEIGLRNMRDFAVMYYSTKIDKYNDEDNMEKAIRSADKMSAVACVIDDILFRMGCEV